MRLWSPNFGQFGGLKSFKWRTFSMHFIVEIANLETLCTYTISNLILKISFIPPLRLSEFYTRRLSKNGTCGLKNAVVTTSWGKLSLQVFGHFTASYLLLLRYTRCGLRKILLQFLHKPEGWCFMVLLAILVWHSATQQPLQASTRAMVLSCEAACVQVAQPHKRITLPVMS